MSGADQRCHVGLQLIKKINAHMHARAFILYACMHKDVRLVGGLVERVELGGQKDVYPHRLKERVPSFITADFVGLLFVVTLRHCFLVSSQFFFNYYLCFSRGRFS